MYRNRNIEDTFISIAKDEHFSTSKNLINHDKCNCSSTNQLFFDNFEAPLSQDNHTQISQQENINNKNNDIQSILESFHKEAPSEYSYCHNCNQCQNKTLLESYGNDSPYFTSFSTHSILYVNRQRKFKFVSSTTNESNAEEITLCYKCAHLLAFENDYKTANDKKFVWLSFIWYLLNNNDIRREYGEQISSFIPSVWRFLRIEKANEICLPNITIDYPPAKGINSTIKRNKWHKR